MLNLRLLRPSRLCPLCCGRRSRSTAEIPDLRAIFKLELKKLGRIALTSEALALNHFDSFYSQIYGDKWPSMRLALLSPKKHVGVVNMFADEDGGIRQLRETGRKNVIPGITSAAREYLSELKTTEAAPQDREVTEEEEEFYSVDEQAVIRRRKTLLSALSRNITEDSRTNVNEFVPVTEIISEHEMMYHADRKKQMPSSPFLEWGEASEEDNAKPLDVIYETVDDFNVSPLLKVYALPRGIVRGMGKPKYSRTGVAQFLPVNGSSIIPILALNLKENDCVLDMCAAPGAKTVMLLQTMLPGKVVCVDSSSRRFSRLRSVVHAYGPAGAVHSGQVELQFRDGRHFSWNEPFDKVLVDVPCSGDRYAATSYMHNIFSSKRANERRRLPETQRALLTRALQLCRVGGEVVYSTCTLSPVQNEGVVRAALARVDGMRFAAVDLSHLRHALQESFCRFHDDAHLGLTVLPFLPNNYGPAYICKLRRVA